MYITNKTPFILHHIQQYKYPLLQADLTALKHAHTQVQLPFFKHERMAQYLLNDATLKFKRILLRLRLQNKAIYLNDLKM